MVAAASFYISSPGAVDWLRLAGAVFGIGLLAGGIFALNHYAERNTDGLMRRTESRPLPSGRLEASEALVFGSALTLASILFLTLLYGWVSGAIAVFTFASYVLVYTPLKRITVLHTALGALPGAMPPLIGWAAARGGLDLDAWILFAILLFWQFPHFLSIEMMYSDDYAKAGIRVLPVLDPSWKASAVGINGMIVLLIAASVLPVATGFLGSVYLFGAIALGSGFLACGAVALARRDRRSARLVLLGSVFYLPVLFGLMIVDVAR